MHSLRPQLSGISNPSQPRKESTATPPSTQVAVAVEAPIDGVGSDLKHSANGAQLEPMPHPVEDSPQEIDQEELTGQDPAGDVLLSAEQGLPESAPTHDSGELAATCVPDVLLGSQEITPQFGILGRFSGGAVGLDLTGCNTISLFGVQGFGKSYTLGVIAEMATTRVEGINILPSPLATVIFHYHKSDAYAPEFAAAQAPNNKVREVQRLLREYGAQPHGLRDVVLLTPEAKLRDRKDEFPGLEVLPIKFSSSELGAESWKFLLGAYGNDSLYIRQLVSTPTDSA